MAKHEIKIEQEISELRELVREAHEAIRDLRTEKKDLRRVREEFVNADELCKRLDDAAGAGILSFRNEMSQQIEKATQAVWDRFDTIMMIALGEDPESVRTGERTVEDLLQEFIRTRNLPVKLTEKVHILMSAETAERERNSPEVIAAAELFGKRGFDGLPIIPDRRVPFGIAIFVIPPLNAETPRIMAKVNVLTGDGISEARDALVAYSRKRYELERERLAQVPDAFKRKERTGPA